MPEQRVNIGLVSEYIIVVFYKLSHINHSVL